MLFPSLFHILNSLLKFSRAFTVGLLPVLIPHGQLQKMVHYMCTLIHKFAMWLLLLAGNCSVVIHGCSDARFAIWVRPSFLSAFFWSGSKLSSEEKVLPWKPLHPRPKYPTVFTAEASRNQPQKIRPFLPAHQRFPKSNVTLRRLEERERGANCSHQLLPFKNWQVSRTNTRPIMPRLTSMVGPTAV